MIIPKEQIMWEVFCKFEQGYKLLDYKKRWQQPNGENMTDKEIIINGVDVSKCKWHTNLKMDCLELPTQPCKCANDPNCYFKQRIRAEQKYEELRQEHNRCCEEFKQEINLRIDAYNKLSRDFWSGKYCNAKYCKQLQTKEQERSELFNCLKQANGKRYAYKQALVEIEKLAKENVELLEGYHLEQANCLTILEIINKAKEQ